MKTFKQYLEESYYDDDDDSFEFELSSRDESKFNKFLELAKKLNSNINKIQQLGKNVKESEELNKNPAAVKLGKTCVSIIDQISKLCDKFDDEEFGELVREYVMVADNVYTYADPSNYAVDGEFSPVDIDQAERMKDHYEQHGELSGFAW